MTYFRFALLLNALPLLLVFSEQARADGLISPLPLATEVLYDFEDQALGPIGNGGAAAGQPQSIGAGMEADVVVAGSGGQALEISKPGGGSGLVYFQLPGNVGITEGMVRARFQFTPSELDEHQIIFRNPSSASETYGNLYIRRSGNITAHGAGLLPDTVGSYTAGETLNFVVDFNLDDKSWSVEFNGEEVVTNRPFDTEVTDGFGRIGFGYRTAAATGHPFELDNVEILLPAPMTTLLQADFNDKVVDSPIGTGGASAGEPLVINPDLTAKVVSFDDDDLALNIEKSGDTGANTFVEWAFLQDVAISEGHMLVEFDLTPRVGMMHQFRLEATNGGGTPEELLRVSTENLGSVRVRFPDDFFGPIVGNYEVDETLNVRIACNFDDRHCSVALDGVWVVKNRAFADSTSADIAIDRFLSGVSGLSATGGHYDLNNLWIRANRVPSIPAEMTFIDQPVDTQCGDGQPLNVQVTAGDGSAAANMIDVYLRPVHSDITAGYLAGTWTFTWEGVAEFPSLNVLKRGNSLRLVAEIEDLFNPVSVTSEPFDVLPGTPNFASYLNEPDDRYVGQTFDPPVALTILDNCGETSIAGREISLYVLEGPSGATLSGAHAVTDAEGEVVFPDFSIDQPGTYRIAARYDGTGISGSSSEWFTIETAPPASATFQVQPSSVIVTETMTPPVEIYVENILDKPIVDGTEVTLALVDAGTASLSGATASTVDGVAIFDALQVDEPDSYQLRASVPDLPTESEPVSAAFDVVPGPAALVSFESQPTGTVAGATISPIVTVRVTDINGFDVADGEMVTLSVGFGPAGSELSGTVAQSTIDGIASFDDLSLTVAGQYALDAQLDEGLASGSDLFDIAPADPFQMSFTVPPASATVNQSLEPAVTVSVEDAFGNAVSDGQSITLAIVEGPDTASLADAAATTVDGLAQFPALAINQPGAFRLEARADTVPVDNRPSSDPFDILPGDPAAMSFAQQPTQTNAGASISPAVAVSVTDADGFAVSDGTTVTLALASGPAEGELLGTLDQETIDGVATFPGLSLQVTGTYSLVASVATGVQVISNEFQLNSASIDLLTYLNPPGDGTVNQPLTPAITVEARDEFGNLVTGNRTILLARSEFPEGGSVGGSMADTNNGVATFDSVTLNRPGTWRLRATAGGVPPGNRPVSEPFEIAPGPPASLEFEQAPSTAVIDEPITPAVSVRVVDADGFDVADGALVEIAIASGPGGAELAGTLIQATSDGLAVFPDLSLDLAGEYTLQASVDAGAITGTSATINVLDTNPASATFLSQPSDTPVGEIMTPAVAVEVLDGESGPVADGSAVVLVLVEPGEATLSGEVSTTSDGVAVFDALVVSRPGSYQLRAEVSGLDPGAQPVSNPFEVLPGPAANMLIEQQPTNTFAGQVITPAIRVRLVDEFDTPLPDGQAVTASIAGGPSGATISGTTTRTTVDGVAVFDDLILEQPGGEYSLTFSHAELSVTSDDFAILADRLFDDRFEVKD